MDLTEKKFILDGYRFKSEDDFLAAKRELKQISDIKKMNDLSDEENLRRVYDALVEGKGFSTPIGLGFLREAQRTLLKNPEQKKTMRAIPVKFFPQPLKTGGVESSSSEKDYRLKARNYLIVIFFLVLMLAVTFSVTVYDRSLPMDKAREAVLNEYASWKEELVSKEKELVDREKLIKEKEALINRGEQKSGQGE